MYIGPGFVFLAVPRTASNTITTLFLPQFGGCNTGEYHACCVPHFHRHKFTFAVVRNPYDRMLSCWYHLRRNDQIFNIRSMDFPEHMQPQKDKWGPDGRSQAEILSYSRIDRVLRYENLAEEVLDLPFNLDRLPWPTEVRNSEERPPWQEELQRHPDWVEIINRHSAHDFERFGYDRL